MKSIEDTTSSSVELRECFLCDIALAFAHFYVEIPYSTINLREIWNNPLIHLFCCNCFKYIITPLFNNCQIVPDKIGQTCRIIHFSDYLNGMKNSRRYEIKVNINQLELVLEAVFG